jgi:hypothetical protein
MTTYSQEDLDQMSIDDLETIYSTVTSRPLSTTKTKEETISEILISQKENAPKTTSPKKARGRPKSIVRSTMLVTKKTPPPQSTSVAPDMVAKMILEREVVAETASGPKKVGRPSKKSSEASLEVTVKEKATEKVMEKSAPKISGSILDQIIKSGRQSKVLNPKASFQSSDVIIEKENEISPVIVSQANIVSMSLPVVSNEAKQTISDFLHGIGYVKPVESTRKQTPPSSPRKEEKAIKPKKSKTMKVVESMDEEIEKLGQTISEMTVKEKEMPKPKTIRKRATIKNVTEKGEELVEKAQENAQEKVPSPMPSPIAKTPSPRKTSSKSPSPVSSPLPAPKTPPKTPSPVPSPAKRSKTPSPSASLKPSSPKSQIQSLEGIKFTKSPKKEKQPTKVSPIEDVIESLASLSFKKSPKKVTTQAKAPSPVPSPVASPKEPSPDYENIPLVRRKPKKKASKPKEAEIDVIEALEEPKFQPVVEPQAPTIEEILEVEEQEKKKKTTKKPPSSTRQKPRREELIIEEDEEGNEKIIKMTTKIDKPKPLEVKSRKQKKQVQEDNEPEEQEQEKEERRPSQESLGKKIAPSKPPSKPPSVRKTKEVDEQKIIDVLQSIDKSRVTGDKSKNSYKLSELKDFLKQAGLPYSSGDKPQIAERILELYKQYKI